MLSEQIGERFVRQFLNRRHPVAPQLPQFVESIVVEGDQFAHDRAWPLFRFTQLQSATLSMIAISLTVPVIAIAIVAFGRSRAANLLLAAGPIRSRRCERILR